MGSLAQSSNLQNCIKRTNKIPEYARDFKKEWLTIRGLNKECGNFIRRIDFSGDIFNSPAANRLKKNIREILKAEELGKIKDISSLIFKYCDAYNIERLEEQLDSYSDFHINPDSLEFDKEYYDLCIDRDFPGFKEFFKLICLLNDKVKKEEPIIIFDSDIDSDIDIDLRMERDFPGLKEFIDKVNEEETIIISDSYSDSDSDIDIDIDIDSDSD